MSVKLNTVLTNKISLDDINIGCIKINDNIIFGRNNSNNNPPAIDDPFNGYDYIPNNEIWYKTSDNEPLTKYFDDLSWSDDNEIISHEYDSNSGYCKIKLKNDFIRFPYTKRIKEFYDINNDCYVEEDVGLFTYTDNGSSAYIPNLLMRKVTEIILPSCITYIPNNFGCSTSFTKLDFSQLTQLTKIGNYFLYGRNLETIIFGDMPNLNTIGFDFLYYGSVKNFIMKGSELLTLPLMDLGTSNYPIPDSIYVNDELIEQYKNAVPNLQDKFKPLSEYTEGESL